MHQYAFLIHLRVNVRVTLSTHTRSFTWSGIWVELSKLCGLQDLQPVVSQRLF